MLYSHSPNLISLSGTDRFHVALYQIPKSETIEHQKIYPVLDLFTTFQLNSVLG